MYFNRLEVTTSSLAETQLEASALQAIDHSRQRTLTFPELAINYALELDRKLRDLGVEGPVTFSAHGHTTACTGPESTYLDWRSHEPNSVRALYAAYSSLGLTPLTPLQARQAAASAFLAARGQEIPALNLVYANAQQGNDLLWLYFVNKYLSYFESYAGQYRIDLSVAEDESSVFERLVAFRAAQSVKGGPLVSVVMPTFNAQQSLKFAALSILQQSHHNLELLLVDDCSTDNSLDVAHELSRNDARVRVFKLSQNSGPYVAKNLALAHAQGDFITVHDADDWAFPTRIEEQLSCLLPTSPQAPVAPKVSMGRMLRCTASGQFTRFQPLNWVTDDGAMRLCFPSPLFERRYLLQVLGGWHPVRVGADFEIVQRIRRFDAQRLVVVNKPVMLQLDATQSLTRNSQTHSDERGESPLRSDYRKAWLAWHAKHQAIPFVDIANEKECFASNLANAAAAGTRIQEVTFRAHSNGLLSKPEQHGHKLDAHATH